MTFEDFIKLPIEYLKDIFGDISLNEIKKKQNFILMQQKGMELMELFHFPSLIIRQRKNISTLQYFFNDYRFKRHVCRQYNERRIISGIM